MCLEIYIRKELLFRLHESNPRVNRRNHFVGDITHLFEIMEKYGVKLKLTETVKFPMIVSSIDPEWIGESLRLWLNEREWIFDFEEYFQALNKLDYLEKL